MYNVSIFGAIVDNENAMNDIIAPIIVTTRQPNRLANELTRGPIMMMIKKMIND